MNDPGYKTAFPQGGFDPFLAKNRIDPVLFYSPASLSPGGSVRL
jgi:hypothetical protein